MKPQTESLINNVLEAFQIRPSTLAQQEHTYIIAGDFVSLFFSQPEQKYFLKITFGNPNFTDGQTYECEVNDLKKISKAVEIISFILIDDVVFRFFEHALNSIKIPISSIISNEKWIINSMSILNLDSVYIVESEYSTRTGFNGRLIHGSSGLKLNEKISREMYNQLSAKEVDQINISKLFPKNAGAISFLKRAPYQRFIFSDRRYKVILFVRYFTYVRENRVIADRCRNILEDYIRIQHESFKRESRYRSHFRHALGNKVGVLKRVLDKVLTPVGGDKKVRNHESKIIRDAMEELRKTVNEAAALPFTPYGGLRTDDVLYVATEDSGPPQSDVNPHFDEKGFIVSDLVNSIIRETRIAKPVKSHRQHLVEFRKSAEFIAHVKRGIVSQILSELIINAGKHSLGDYIELAQEASGRNHHRVIIRNLSFTLDKNDQRSIPEAGYRSKRAIQDEIPGSGMGLFDAKLLARQAELTLTFTPNQSLRDSWRFRANAANVSRSVSLFETALVFPDHLVDVI